VILNKNVEFTENSPQNLLRNFPIFSENLFNSIASLKLDEPAEIMYTKTHLIELLKDLETDYYERYEFNDL